MGYKEFFDVTVRCTLPIAADKPGLPQVVLEKQDEYTSLFMKTPIHRIPASIVLRSTLPPSASKQLSLSSNDPFLSNMTVTFEAIKMSYAQEARQDLNALLASFPEDQPQRISAYYDLNGIVGINVTLQEFSSARKIDFTYNRKVELVANEAVNTMIDEIANSKLNQWLAGNERWQHYQEAKKQAHLEAVALNSITDSHVSPKRELFEQIENLYTYDPIQIQGYDWYTPEDFRGLLTRLIAAYNTPCNLTSKPAGKSYADQRSYQSHLLEEYEMGIDRIHQDMPSDPRAVIGTYLAKMYTRKIFACLDAAESTQISDDLHKFFRSAIQICHDYYFYNPAEMEKYNVCILNDSKTSITLVPSPTGDPAPDLAVQQSVLEVVKKFANSLSRSRLYVGSGFRDYWRNVKNGVSNSSHLYGYAIDILLPPGDIKDYMRKALASGAHKVGGYTWGIHIDLRPLKPGESPYFTRKDDPNSVEAGRIPGRPDLYKK